jgi:DNA-binding NarL/FixJ family response regulator
MDAATGRGRSGRRSCRTTVAVGPRSNEFRLSCGGSDGHRSRVRTLRPGYVEVAAAPNRRVVGLSGRAPYQRLRAKRLTPDEQAAVKAAAASGRSLRSLAPEFGVSHETIRAALRERSAAVSANVPAAKRAR